MIFLVWILAIWFFFSLWLFSAGDRLGIRVVILLHVADQVAKVKVLVLLIIGLLSFVGLLPLPGCIFPFVVFLIVRHTGILFFRLTFSHGV